LFYEDFGTGFLPKTVGSLDASSKRIDWIDTTRLLRPGQYSTNATAILQPTAANGFASLTSDADKSLQHLLAVALLTWILT